VARPGGVLPASVFPAGSFASSVPPEPVANRRSAMTHEKGREMGKRDELIAKYADDLRSKCGVTPDMALLTKVTIGCGPAIYDNDAQTVAATDQAERDRVKNNFMIKKLGLKDGPALDEAFDAVVKAYGPAEKNKYRAVFYYMLVKHFKKEGVYA
jgi:hypothetical protein